MEKKETFFLNGDMGDVDRRFYEESLEDAIEKYGIVEYYLERQPELPVGLEVEATLKVIFSEESLPKTGDIEQKNNEHV